MGKKYKFQVDMHFVFFLKRQRLYENLRMIPNAPGVQMQPIPDDGIAEESDDEDAKPHSADHRISSKRNCSPFILFFI